jgi:fatty acid synthase
LILKITLGKGVHVVLNSLTGEKLLASVRCIARHGRFLEIGMADLLSNKKIGLELFLKDASFQGIMLGSLWDLKEDKLKIRELLQEGIESGVVVPLPRRVFKLNQIEPAFRFMGQGSHVGKVLIQIRGGDEPKPIKIIAYPRLYFCPEKSYIIAGGLGGFGLELCNWMTKRYATKLLITSRSGVIDAYQEQYIRKWRKRGILVQVLQVDASTYSQAEFVVKEALKLGPLGGFFNLTMQLEWGLMKVQSVDAFEKVLSSKLYMSLNMSKLTLEMDSLNHFVLFSSVASGFGFDGQSNYGFANSAMEHLCESRQNLGLPATAIQWGGIGEVGAWHDGYNQDLQYISFRGSGVQSIRSALRVLDTLLTNPSPIFLSRREIDVNTGGALTQELSILERIAHILGHRNVEKLNPKSKLIELGMDSVMAIEVKAVLENDYGIVLPAAEVRTCTIEQVVEMSQNGGTNKLVGGKVPNIKAATADLFQLNLMKNYSSARLIHTETLHPINEGKDPSQGVILFCNSIEGPEILRILGPLLTRPTYSLQFTKDMPTNSMIELADHYIKVL